MIPGVSQKQNFVDIAAEIEQTASRQLAQLEKLEALVL